MSERQIDAAGRQKDTAPALNLADLLKDLDLPGRRPEFPGAQEIPKNLPSALQLKPELKPSDWLPPPPISDEQLNKKALQAAKPDANAGKPAPVDAAARDYIINQLTPDDRKQLDVLRLQLSVSTGGAEKDSKAAEIRTYLSSRVKSELSEAGVNAILAQRPVQDMLSEVKQHRPAETAELIKAVRATLVGNAEHAITNGAKLKDFNDKLAEFDARATARGLSQAEVLSTYLQIGRVLNPDQKLEHGDKSLLARSMMANAADPQSIDQGGHNTCNVTALEARMFTQEPGTALKVIADVACGGKFVAADGTNVRPLNLDPDGEGKADPTPDGARNYASQIWQLTAINSYWNRKDTLPGGKTVGKNNIQYAQGPDGEFLLDVSVNPPQKQHFATIDSGHPWLDIFGVSEINEQLTGRPSNQFGIKRWVYSSDGDGVSKVSTLSQFKNKLVEFKEANAFPVLVEVDAAKKPFGDGKGFGPHVVTITDYDPKTGLISVDNQWGKGADMTGLPGQGAKPSAEVLWGSMSPVPGFDFMWEKVKDGLKEVHVKDAGPPTVRALSAKGLTWGISAAAPLAVRGGLGYLSEWGVPGAAGALSASETRLGSVALRAGTSIAALGAFAYINDVPGAFREGTSHGVGKMTRVAGDWASFELGAQVTNKALSTVGLWAPVRIPISLAAGVATTTVFDRLLGEGSEIGGSWVYDRARELFNPDRPLAAPEKAINKPAPAAQPAKLSVLGEKDMTTQFIQRYKSYDELYKK